MDIKLSSADGPPHIVTTGQTISGVVTFDNIKRESTGFITITFNGKSQVEFNKGRSVYQGQATLFNFQQTLHDGPLPQQPSEWKFEFPFPSVTLGDEKKWLDVPPFDVEDGHKLPPSTVFDSTGTDRDAGKGFIVYLLEARFSKLESKSTSVFSSSEPDARIMLYHIPYRQTEIPGPQISSIGKESFTCSSKALDLSNTAAEKKSFFKRSKTPTAVFEISVTAPRVVYVGGPLPITLTLTHDTTNSTVTTPPIIMLKSCTILLTRTIHCVGKALVSEEDGHFTTMEYLGGSSTLSHLLPTTLDLSDLLNITAFHTTYGMSFATYNLVQKFGFLLKATFECAGKTYWTEMRSKEVFVLPPFTRERLDGEGGDLRRLLQGLNGGKTGEVVGTGTGTLEGVLGLAAAAAVFSF